MLSASEGRESRDPAEPGSTKEEIGRVKTREKKELCLRLSFPATGPPDPGRVSEEVSEGVSEGFLKGFRRLLEGVLG